ncbi:MAG TPA: aminotransferase class V-fold PLP-dependent enzyme [Cyclobacteriaceae bacterium]|nr:aminotransferase class V-fold PLP-dependent enzyme [Cyclobacteriaceae bacterium]
MISFYPGPSRVHDEIPGYVKDAARLGIMSMNHRSPEFVAMSKKTIELLKKRLSIPKDYTVFFTSSATECWEIIAQSWVTEKSYHLYNGSFGQKWYEYTRKIKAGAIGKPFDREVALNPEELKFEGVNAILCLTQNETSNGTQVSNQIISAIRKNNPHHLMAVDATSSMAGIVLDFKSADIWFASVQKCFGLPAGLGIMTCSPAAISRAKEINNSSYYNSIVFMSAMMEKWQTPFTPNVLAIYLLLRVLEKSQSIKSVHKTTVSRYQEWNTFLQKTKTLKHLVKNKTVHSYTVLPIEGDPSSITKIKKNGKKQGFLLGEGYGDLKATTFRIANFPALKNAEIAKLKRFLSAL